MLRQTESTAGIQLCAMGKQGHVTEMATLCSGNCTIMLSWDAQGLHSEWDSLVTWQVPLSQDGGCATQLPFGNSSGSTHGSLLCTALALRRLH